MAAHAAANRRAALWQSGVSHRREHQDAQRRVPREQRRAAAPWMRCLYAGCHCQRDQEEVHMCPERAAAGMSATPPNAARPPPSGPLSWAAPQLDRLICSMHAET